jgi:aminopeptidase N
VALDALCIGEAREQSEEARMLVPRRVALLSLVLAACGTVKPPPVDAGVPDGGLPVKPSAKADLTRDVLDVGLDLDLATRAGRASITVAPSTDTGLSFEVGALSILSVQLDGQPLDFTVAQGLARQRRLDIGVPVSTSPSTVTIDYGFPERSTFDGWLPSLGVTFLWPYFCSNLFPCHSDPKEGATYSLRVTGAAPGLTVVAPTRIPNPAPSYMPAFAVGDYRYVRLGSTDAGTEVGYYVLPQEADGGVVSATAHLVELFDWYERTLGPYAFGPAYASVDVHWGAGEVGGMEHHPFSHLAAAAFGDENVHAHEAAHGWFGDGVRIACWEDFVLSEGTTDYLAIRAVEVVRGATAAQAQWDVERQLLDDAVAQGDSVAWPDGCSLDLLSSPLWSNIPYTKGAFFYRRVADQIGAQRLDAILSSFYLAHRGRPARMQDMIDHIRAESGFDPGALAQKYLRSLGNPEL